MKIAPVTPDGFVLAHNLTIPVVGAEGFSARGGPALLYIFQTENVAENPRPFAYPPALLRRLL